MFIMKSNLFTCSEDILTRNRTRANSSLPSIELSPEFAICQWSQHQICFYSRTRANSSLPSIELGPEFVKIFAKGVDAHTVVLMAARASRVENQDAIDSAIVGMLADPKEVIRDGKWNEEDAAVLVLGDIISIKLGDIVPADARLLDGDPLKIDQSTLTGESLTVTKNPGDGVYSGSMCKQGEIEAVVIATGVHTFFGKVSHLVDSTNQVGHFQKVLTAIGNFCICSIAVGMIIEIIVMYPIQHWKYRPGIDNLLVLLIGGIPIAMPTVLSVTMAIGSHRLSQQGAITKRMTAIEEMAGMDVLCSDKTETLTLNKLTVDKNLIEIFAKGVDADTVVLMAARASRVENQDAIDSTIVGIINRLRASAIITTYGNALFKGSRTAEAAAAAAVGA